MVSVRQASRRAPARYLALACVIAASAAAPKASAGLPVYWMGGSYDDWMSYNWYFAGISGVTWPIVTAGDVYFGYGSGSYHDDNGLVTQSGPGNIDVSSLNFAGQDWHLNGNGGFYFEGKGNSISAAGGTNVTIDNYITCVGELFVTLNSDISLHAVAGSSITINNDIWGTAAVYKSGDGTASLTHFHTYPNGTNVAAGRLIDYYPVGNYYTNADLEFSPYFDTTLTGSIVGGGNLIKRGGTTLTLTGAVSYGGATSVNGGRLIATTPWSSSQYSFNGGDLELRPSTSGTYGGLVNGTGTFTKSGSNTLTLTGTSNKAGGVFVTGGQLIESVPMSSTYALNGGSTLQFKVDSGSQTFQGTITGDGAFTKSGAGIVYLMGTGNTYTGNTLVLQGTLADSHLHGNYATIGDLQSIGGDQSYNGMIVGSGSFGKVGAGTLTLTGINTYTGGTMVDGGRLIDLNPHGNYKNNSQLEFANASDVLYRDSATLQPNVISGLGHFTKSGAGSLVFFAPNSYAGSTTINGGAIFSLADNVLPTSTDLTVGANGTFATANGIRQTVASLTGAGSVSLGDSSVFTVSGTPSTTFSGVISGPGQLVKSGAGTLTLSGGNTYTKGTTVNGGRLIDFNPHGTYVTNAALEFAKAGDYTYATALTGNGSFTKSGAGTLTLSGVNTYTGSTIVETGRLIDLNPHGKYMTNAALEFQMANNASLSDQISGTGSVTKSGSATLTLTGGNSYTGGTTVSGGSLVVLNPNGSYVNNATLEFSRTTNFTFDGAISGNGTFIKDGNGTLTLRGAVSAGQSTKLSGGTLKVSSPNFQAGVSSNGGTLQFEPTAASTYSSKFIGSGALLKTGNQSLTLTNAPGNTGGTRVSGGSLGVTASGKINGGLTVDSSATFLNGSGAKVTIDGRSFNQGSVATSAGSTTAFTGLVSGTGNFNGAGTVRFDGGYSPGNSPATVTFQGNLLLGSTNGLTMELGSSAIDHLNVLGTATLGGRLDVAWYGGFTATKGQAFDLFDFANSSGAFSSVNLPTLGSGLVWNTSGLYTTGTIRVQSVPEPASMIALGLGGLALLRRRRK